MENNPISRERLREFAKRHNIKRGRDITDTMANLIRAGLLLRKEVPLFICTACEHVYMGEVTQCDCMPKVQEFYRSECRYWALTPPESF